MVIFQIGT